MEILINKAIAEIQPEESEKLGHLFMRLEDYFNQKNQSVINVCVDKAPINAEQQKVMSGEDVSTYDSLEIQVVDTKTLPIHTLREFKPLLSEVAATAEKVAIELQSGKTSEALKNIGSLFQVWAVLFQTLSDSSKLLNFNLTSVNVDSSNVEELTKKLTQHLLEIKEGLKNRDYVTVADIVEYEISPSAEKWIPVIDILIEHMTEILANEPTQQ